MIRLRQGFTAIELVTALTILMGITAMLGIILARGNRIWSDSTEAARTRQAGRRVLELLTRDLESSVTDELFPLLVDASDPDLHIGEYISSRLRFVTLGTIGYDGMAQQRVASAVGYWIEPTQIPNAGGFTLVRGTLHQTNVHVEAADDNLYWQTNIFDYVEDHDHPFAESEPIANHVSALRIFWPADEQVRELADDYTYDSREHTNRPPPFLDIFLELLTPSDARQLARLTEPDRQAAFVDQRAIRYTTRVALGNRWGRAYRGR